MIGRQILLLSLTVVVCSALTNPEDVKSLRAQRGLQKRHHEYMNGCKTAYCYINLWDNIYDGDIAACRQNGIPVFKACLQQVLDSSNICTCGFQQVKRDMDKLDDDLICEKEIRPPAYYGYTACDDPQAEECRQKNNAFWDMTKEYTSNLPRVADRQQALSEAESCAAGVVADGVSTVGCTNTFTWAGDMDATRGAVAAYVFAQGCDNVDGILSKCTPPEAITVDACDGEYDDVLTFLDCAKDVVSEGCRSMVTRASRILQLAKYAACQRLQQVKEKVYAHCGREEKRRTLLQQLLQLLTAKNRQ